MADAPDPTTPQAGADTGGWDVVHAIGFSALNAQIAAQASWPATFDIGDPSDPVNNHVSGSFGPWALVTGSGLEVTFGAPIPAVKLVLEGTPSEYANLEATFKVNLDWVVAGTPSTATHVPCPDAPDAIGARELRMGAATATGDADPDPDVPIVKDVTGPGMYQNGQPTEEQEAISMLLGEWFAANPGAFQHLFATVDLAAELAEASHLQWLMPTSLAYAVGEPIADASGAYGEPVFAVLAMTECHPPTHQHAMVSGAAIPPGATSALLISSDQFAQHFVLASVPVMFQDATIDEFRLDQGVVSNLRTLQLQDWTLNDKAGTVVHPSVAPGDFTVTIYETTLEVAFADISFDYGSATCHVVYNNVGTLYLTDDGHADIRPIRSTSSAAAIVSDRTQLAWILVDIGITVFTIAVGAVVAGIASAAEGAASAAEDAVTVTESVITYSEDATTLAGADAGSEAQGLSQAQAEAFAIAAGTSDFATWAAGALPRILLRMGKAIGIALIMGAPGMVVSLIPQILQAAANDQLGDLPGLDKFADYAVSPVSWTGLPDRETVSVALHGSLVIGMVAKSEGGVT